MRGYLSWNVRFSASIVNFVMMWCATDTHKCGRRVGQFNGNTVDWKRSKTKIGARFTANPTRPLWTTKNHPKLRLLGTTPRDASLSSGDNGETRVPLTDGLSEA